MQNILIADDNINVRTAIRLVLERKVRARVVGEASRGDEVLDAVAALRPDLLLLDWELPGRAVEHLLPLLRGRFSGLRVVVMSSRCEAGPAALRCGADGFVSKSAPVEELLEAVMPSRPASGR